ncbi:MAG TPA: hypothetical protein VKB07_10180 [Gaiellaceae bacterium]|nr:hypothetical protein [Gaiellaceae bacterium]
MKRRTLCVVSALCAALALAAPAAGDLQIGVVDDQAKGAAPERFFGQMSDIGLSEVRVTILWDPAEPLTIRDQPAIERLLPFAQARGIKILFVLDLANPRAVGNSTAAAGRFAAFAAHVARTFPSVRDIIVGNEPNQTRFWQPQYNANGSPAACVAYERLLAASYDALKQVDRGVNVIGVGLSPRGNDSPKAGNNVSRSPIRCLRDIGAAYRGSARRLPIMDELSFHPYPRSDRDSLLKGYQWPNAGVPNLDRIKQAVWDAFNGTRQPTFAERGRAGGLRFRLDEVGWQVRIVASAAHAYEGVENVPTTEEASQAQIYGGLIRYLACDPTVRSLLFFGLIDEPSLDRWQAALVRADGTPRPAYGAVKSTFAETGGRCVGSARPWRHSTTVAGARAIFPRGNVVPANRRSWVFKVRADEGARFRAGIFRVKGPSKVDRKGIARSLTRSGGVLRATGAAKAHRTPQVKFRNRKLAPGWYVYGVRLSAETNAKRASTFVSRPFGIKR